MQELDNLSCFRARGCAHVQNLNNSHCCNHLNRNVKDAALALMHFLATEEITRAVFRGSFVKTGERKL